MNPAGTDPAIQFRWGDEQVWKDLPQIKTVAEAQASWDDLKAKDQGRMNLPPDPEIREKPGNE